MHNNSSSTALATTDARYLSGNQNPYPQGHVYQPGTGVAPANPTTAESNELLRMASPLITLITQIRHTVNHPKVDSLRAQVIEEVRTFERKLTAINYPPRTITAARYCLCTAIDEAVLSQNWGTQSSWVQNSLLNLFQKENWGGERFYIILEDALRDTHNNVDFIEMIYFLLSLGFEGKFFGEENHGVREEIRNRVFYCIRHARMKPERSLSPHWKNMEMPVVNQQRRKRLKRMALASLTLIIVLGIFYNASVYSIAKPTLTTLNNLANTSPVTTFSQLINRPIVAHGEPATEGN